MKVLILVPHLFKPGGVANYYTALRKQFSSNIDFFFRGNRNQVKNKFLSFDIFGDYVRFLFNLISKNHELYVINTSFASNGCTRDSFYVFLLSLFKKKFVVFFRGWDKDFEIKTDLSKNFKKFPIKYFLKADGIIVLAQDFKSKILSWGYKGPIYLETTVVDESLFKSYYFNKSKFSNREDKFVFLFLARVEKEKGLYEIIEIFNEIQNQNKFSKFELIIAGDGSSLQELKDFVKKEGFRNIIFTGYISGDKKIEVLSNSHFFLFPTKHGEGMPNSVLEAMAFGLPILTTGVGGIKDFFIDGKMGLLVGDEDSKTIANRLINVISDNILLAEISAFNHQYAKENFFSSKVSVRLLSIFSEIIHEDYSLRKSNF